MNNNNVPERRGFLFNVDILIESPTNKAAMEKLMRLMNNEDVIDFKVHRGMNLGTIIEEMLKEKTEKEIPADTAAKPSTKRSTAETAKSEQAKEKLSKPTITQSMLDSIKTLIANNTLIRLYINKGKGGKVSIPCRVLNFDMDSEVMTVYHVDEKSVYAFNIYEIDDFTIS